MTKGTGDTDLRVEMYQLTELSLRGEITSNGIERLEWLLSNEEAARKYYVEYLLQSISLGCWAATASELDPTGLAKSVAPQKPTVFPVSTRAASTAFFGDKPSLHIELSRYLHPIASFALGVSLAIAGTGFWLAWRSPNVDSARPPVPGTSVAYLTSVNGCDWGSGPMRMQSVGTSISTGDEIKLHEGIAEFTLSSGVSLSVEGPAALIMASPSSIVLQYGKLTAKVPWSASDFRLSAASCQIAAREADFGVIYSAGQVDVHVFLGSVEAASSPFFERATRDGVISTRRVEEFADFDPVRIERNEAVLFAADERSTESLERHPADRSRFATKLSMEGRLPISQKYVDAIRQSKPTAYWRFESIANGSVKNEIENGPALKVIGDLTLAGDAQNHVAEFGSSPRATHLVGVAPLTSLSDNGYTVELCAKPSHFHRGVLVAMSTEHNDPKIQQPEKHGMMLELLRSYEGYRGHPGSVRFLHRNPLGIKLGTSCFSNQLYALRRWQHIVAVKGKSSMQLYIDGTLVAKEKDATPLPRNLTIVLGQTFQNQTVFPFVGQLDELVLYGRALNEDEIKKHFELIQEVSPNGTRI